MCWYIQRHGSLSPSHCHEPVGPKPCAHLVRFCLRTAFADLVRRMCAIDPRGTCARTVRVKDRRRGRHRRGYGRGGVFGHGCSGGGGRRRPCSCRCRRHRRTVVVDGVGRARCLLAIFDLVSQTCAYLTLKMHHPRHRHHEVSRPCARPFAPDIVR